MKPSMRVPVRVGVVCLLLAASAPGLALPQPSAAERDELDARIEAFYRSPAAAVMDRKPAKFRVRDGRETRPNEAILGLGAPADTRDPLLRHARAKATPRFRAYRCRKFWRHFPRLGCDEPKVWSSSGSADDVAELADSWLDRAELVYSLDALPLTGQVKTPYWSGDYWRMRWGLTSYRYSEGVQYKEYEKAVAAYQQPAAWTVALATLKTPTELAAAVVPWSPAEKYDLTLGAEAFPLTNEQKTEGRAFIGEDGKVEDWYGLCDGWAPAAVFAPAAVKPVTATGARGVKVTWYPHDVRALVTLAWTNGDYYANFVGGRCDEEKPKRFPNGRLSQEECFDTNPATLHLALGNLVGKASQAFMMDARFDAEVWNQPIVAYQFKYYNPLKPTERGTDWRTHAVPYDATFKARDRFQKPLTRGQYAGRKWNDSQVKQIVGVIATVVYLTEMDAKPWPEMSEDELVRVNYVYDLELHEEDGKLVPRGGEWLGNVHPDFLWVPQKHSIALSRYDNEAPQDFSLAATPSPALRTVAERAAADAAYPICDIVRKLLDASAERPGAYQCR